MSTRTGIEMILLSICVLLAFPPITAADVSKKMISEAPAPVMAPIPPETSLVLAGFTFKLGDKKEIIESLISKRYKLVRVTDSNTYFMTTRDKPYDWVGSMEFEDGRLTSITKSWGNFTGKEAMELSQSLFSSISGAKEHIFPASIKTSIMREPNFSTMTIKIDFLSNRSVTINIFEKVNESTPQISIDETVQTFR